MREILFRGKQVGKDEWVCGYFIKYEPSNECFIHDGYSCERLTEVTLDSIGQYTGLKDKNGVEIFEGDLLKSYDEHGNIDVDKVIYNTSHCKFMLVSDSESRLPIGLGEYSSFTLEVIGNIHEVTP